MWTINFVLYTDGCHTWCSRSSGWYWWCRILTRCHCCWWWLWLTIFHCFLIKYNEIRIRNRFDFFYFVVGRDRESLGKANIVYRFWIPLFLFFKLVFFSDLIQQNNEILFHYPTGGHERNTLMTVCKIIISAYENITKCKIWW